ncbi:MAG TPA: guanylate kinase [Candidatus Paceibacterota bacterium]|nr:guanylate kinase [Candidatus Paceibacterota bacterium]
MEELYIIVVGSSGAGKTRIAQLICEMYPKCMSSVSNTDRSPRGKETHAVDYYFRHPDKFDLMLTNDEFAEHNPNYVGKRYGTTKLELQRILDLGKIPVLDIDYVGAEQMRTLYGQKAYIVFIESPIELARKRLKERYDLSDEEIEGRLKRAVEEEIPFAYSRPDVFDVIVENKENTVLDVLANQILNAALEKQKALV